MGARIVEKTGVTGIVLAAGFSSRMDGLCKLVLPYRGLPLVVRAVRLLAPHCGRILVVTGAHDGVVRSALHACPEVERVYHPRYAEGMFSSVRAGLAAALQQPRQAQRVLLLPGDCVAAGPDVPAVLLRIPADVAIPTWQAKPGHPVMMSRSAVESVLASPEEGTLRDCLWRMRPILVPVDDSGILVDVDTREAYGLLLRWPAHSVERFGEP